MNTEYNQPTEQIAPAYPPMPPSKFGKIFALVAVFGLGVAVFGAACVLGGMQLMKYVDRLESLERGVGRVDAIKSYPPRETSRAAHLAAAPASVPAGGQPQIYFMMGAQPAQQPVQAAMPWFQPDVNTEMNQFILNKYQAEFSEYMRQRTIQYPASAHMQGAFALWFHRHSRCRRE